MAETNRRAGIRRASVAASKRTAAPPAAEVRADARRAADAPVAAAAPPGYAPAAARRDDVMTITPGQRVEVPVVAEELSVEKRKVDTGQVVVHVQPRVERQELEVPLTEETVEVQRVPVNRFVDGPVPVRQEGDVTIVPVFEEVLVVEKRLMLKEEVRLVRRRVATRERQTFDVRKEEVHVLRSDETAEPAANDGTSVAKPSPVSGDGGSVARS